MFTYGRTASVYNDCFCSVPFVNDFAKTFTFSIKMIHTIIIFGSNSEIMLSIELYMYVESATWLCNDDCIYTHYSYKCVHLNLYQSKVILV